MPRKLAHSKTHVPVPVVNYAFGDRTYQIDTKRQKVYRQFVEIETSRAAEIFASWRAQNVVRV